MTHIRKEDIATPKDEWETPPELFKKLDDEFHFDCDAAATSYNYKCEFWFGRQLEIAFSDALKIPDWQITFKYPNKQPPEEKTLRRFFLNPPYTHGMLEKFMKKAYTESLKGAIVVCLVPFSGAGWFQKWCMKAYEIRILGRVQFTGYLKDGTPIRNSPTFDSCIVIFDAAKKKLDKHPLADRYPILTVWKDLQ